MGKYPHSFVLGSRAVKGAGMLQVSGWSTNFYVSGELSVSRASGRGQALAILGIAVVPELGIASSQEAANWLSSEPGDMETLWNKLAKVAGRFVLVAELDGQTFVVPDATGSRPIFYAKDIAGSHAHLLGDQLGIAASQKILSFVSNKHYRKGIWPLPGDISAFDGVRLVLGNSVLNLSKNKIDYMNLTAVDASTRVADVAATLASSYKAYRDQGRVMLSLTAGVDSRMSFAAALADGRDFSCFTYVASGQSQRDADAAAALCERFGVSHRSIPVTKAPADFVQRHQTATAYIRCPDDANTIYSCSQALPKGVLEIKSSVSEIGRAFYRRRMIFPPARLEKKGMAALYKNWLPKPERNIAREAFSSLSDLSRHKGFDPLDILYWEHSLSAWQGLQLQDYELSHQTVSLFNNRSLLVQLLSLPLSSRLNDEAQRSIVACLHSDVPLPSLYSGHSMKKILRTVMFNAMSS